MCDRLFIIPNESKHIGEVVVADRIIRFDGNGLEVHGSCEEILALRAVAASHVAVGLEIAGIIHQCP